VTDTPGRVVRCAQCGWGNPVPVEVPVDRDKENRRVFALISKLGIGTNERRELAMMLPSQSGAAGPPSFSTLTGAELVVLGQWLTGIDMGLELAKLRQQAGSGD
jgi:hypothetical protein